MSPFNSTSNTYSPGERPAPVPPEGFRWALIPQSEDAGTARHGIELIKFDDPKSFKLKEFKYERLANMNKSIRLLYLMAGKQDTSEVECQMFEAEIGDGDGRVWVAGDPGRTKVPVKYEALSWSWGTGAQEYQILIRKGNKRRRKKASKELVLALCYLRYQDKDRILWIDALCINQQNVEEKNHQVQMMSRIYSYADRVCIWLGLDDKESNMAIKFIKKEILQLAQFDALCADERNSEKWQALLVLMQRQWFFRRWVVQEIALAKDAIIYCGPDEISWKDFSVAVELFVEVETATHRLSEVMKKDPRFYHVPGWFEYVSALGASLLVQATGMIFRYYKLDKEEGTGRDTKNDSGGDSNTNGQPFPNSQNPVVQDDKASENGEGSGESEEEEDTEREEVNESELDYEFDSDKEEQDEPDGLEAGVDGTNAELKDPTSEGLEKFISIREASPHDPISQRRPLLSLEYLVSNLSIFEATEPRDAIYALLAIANDAFPAAEGSDDQLSLFAKEILSEKSDQKPFSVNYGRPYADVCQDFIEFCISRSDKSRALDIICRPWAPDPKRGPSVHFHSKPKSEDLKKYLKILEQYHENPEQRHSPEWPRIISYFPEQKLKKKKPTLPSWIPRLKGAPFSMFSTAGVHIMKMGRKNADPLVGLPTMTRSYDAAQGMPVDLECLKFRKRRSQNAHCMFVKGFILETVEKTADSSQAGNIPKEWLKLGSWKILKDPDKDKGPPEEFWRTIVADRGKDSRNPPYYYPKACKESVYKGGFAGGSVITSDLINNERNSIVAEFCRRVQAVIWNRSLIKTDKGNLGVASKLVRPGDLVCILYGCSVPVILRRFQKKEDVINQEKDEDELYEVLEKNMRNLMGKAKANRQRKQHWESLPDEATGHFTYGKKDVKKWVEDYKKLLENNKAKIAEGKMPVRDAKPPTPTSSETRGEEPKASPAKQREDCYYKFLGECYIHGMMDGEAIKRKVKFEEEVDGKWKEVKERLVKEHQKKLSRKEETSVSHGNGADGGENRENGKNPTLAAQVEDSQKNHDPKLLHDSTGEIVADDKDASEDSEIGKIWESWRGEMLLDMIFELR